MPFSILYATISQGYLSLENEDSLYHFISRGIETNREMHGLLEFVRLEYCSPKVMNDFFEIFSGYFYEINASKWASIRRRLLANVKKKSIKQFPPPLVKKRVPLGVPNGIIAHLTRECGGNVHDNYVVDVTSGSFEKETNGANPHSGAWKNDPRGAAKNAADLETNSCFYSAFLASSENIRNTRNNWICYDFKERRLVPTHYTIRSNRDDPDYFHLRSWLVETSVNRKSWREVAHQKRNRRLNGSHFAALFSIAGGEECRFIRLVNIGKNHGGNDQIWICALFREHCFHGNRAGSKLSSA
jgi:hypothetical protein